jgi:hypothetical protein
MDVIRPCHCNDRILRLNPIPKAQENLIRFRAETPSRLRRLARPAHTMPSFTRPNARRIAADRLTNFPSHLSGGASEDLCFAKIQQGETAMKTSRKLMFPPPREWQNIVQDFELKPTQAETLKVTLEEALDAINQYQAKLQNQPNRSDLVKGLKNFEKALRRLRDECRRSADLIEHFLPDGTLAFIGQSLTFAAISEALERDLSPKRFDFYFKNRIKRERGERFTVSSVEQDTRPKRETSVSSMAMCS